MGTLGVLVLSQLALVVAMLLLVDRTAWHVNLPRSIRLGIVTHELALAAPWFLGLALIGLAAARLRGWRRRAAYVAVGVFALAWFTSWATFWTTGRFVDREALMLAAASPGSMLLHGLQFAPLAFVLLPLSAIAFTFAFVALARVGARAWPAIRLASLLLALVALWLAHSTARDAASVLTDNEQRIAHPRGTTTLGNLYRSLRDEHTGPVAYLYASLGRPSVTTQQDAGIEVVWPPKARYAANPPARPFNVIVLVVESLRSDELAAWGSRLPVMPNTDALARESVVFLDHVAAATHSNYSTVVPVSGQYPLRDPNAHIYPADPAYPRVHLYDVLKPLGYRTAIISSQNESWGGMANFLASDRLDYFLHSETFTGPRYVEEEDYGFARFARQFGRAGKIDDRLTIDEAIRWIGDAGQPPFFTYINLQNTHVPYPIPASAPAPFAARERDFSIRFNLFPADSVEKVRGIYRNALHYVDVQIGRLVAHLRATGQLDRTILMVMGDHGQAFLEHGFGAHGNELYEELLRTPLIVHAPGLTPELRRGLAHHVDVASTVLGLLGLPPHPAFQGIDLFAAQRTYAYVLVQTPLANQYGITNGRWKLVVDGHRGTAVLRDLVRDPREQLDFVAQDTAVARALRRRVDTWREAQLKYYRTPALRATTYAPVLPEPRPPA